MGCDFYILKLLRIYHNETDYVAVEIEREKGYFDDLQFDEDADDYDDKWNDYIQEILIPKCEPIIIYRNGSFNKSSCESKYKVLVENEIRKYDKQWSDITKIVKVEERYER